MIRNAIGHAAAHRAGPRPKKDDQLLGWYEDKQADAKADAKAARTELANQKLSNQRRQGTVDTWQTELDEARAKRAELLGTSPDSTHGQVREPSSAARGGSALKDWAKRLTGAAKSAASWVLGQTTKAIKSVAAALKWVRGHINTLHGLIDGAKKQMSHALAVIRRKLKSAKKRAADWLTAHDNPDKSLYGYDRTGVPPHAEGAKSERVEARVFYDPAGADKARKVQDDARVLRKQPRPDGDHVRTLRYNDQVFIDDAAAAPLLDKRTASKRLYRNAKANGWSWVATADGHEGYVDHALLDTRLPCPGAQLYRVKPNDTALGIAHHFYGAREDKDGKETDGDEQPGQDGRFFVNVLQYVNQNVTMDRDPRKWDQVHFKAGFSIWIPPAEFAKSLHGKVDSGSLTGGLKAITEEKWREATGVAKDSLDLIIGIPAFIDGLYEGARKELKSDVIGLFEAPEQFLDEFKKLVRGELLSEIKQFGEALGQIDAHQMTQELWADWNQKDPWEKWKFRGEIIGAVGIEVVLAYLTAGLAAEFQIATKFQKLAAFLRETKLLRGLLDGKKKFNDKLTQQIREFFGEKPKDDPAAGGKPDQGDKRKRRRGEPKGLPEDLLAIRRALKTRAGRKQFDAIWMRRTEGEVPPAAKQVKGFRRQLENMAKSYDGDLDRALQRDAARDKARAKANKRKRIPLRFRGRMRRMRAEVSALEQRCDKLIAARPDSDAYRLKGAVKDAAGEPLRLTEDGVERATSKRLTGIENEIRSRGAEISEAEQAPPGTKFSEEFAKDGPQGETDDSVEIDQVAPGGAQWIDIKDYRPFEIPGGKAAEKSIKTLTDSAERQLDAAGNHPLPDGTIPEVVFRFRKGVTDSVRKKIESVVVDNRRVRIVDMRKQG